MPATYNGNPAGLTKGMAIPITVPVDTDPLSAASSNVGTEKLADYVKKLYDDALFLDVANTLSNTLDVTGVIEFQVTHACLFTGTGSLYGNVTNASPLAYLRNDDAAGNALYVEGKHAVTIVGLSGTAIPLDVRAATGVASPVVAASFTGGVGLATIGGSGAAFVGGSGDGAHAGGYGSVHAGGAGDAVNSTGGQAAFFVGGSIAAGNTNTVGSAGNGATFYGGNIAADASGRTGGAGIVVYPGTGQAGAAAGIVNYGDMKMQGSSAAYNLAQTNNLSPGLICKAWARVRCASGVLTVVSGQNINAVTAITLASGTFKVTLAAAVDQANRTVSWKSDTSSLDAFSHDASASLGADNSHVTCEVWDVDTAGNRVVHDLTTATVVYVDLLVFGLQ